MAVNIKEPAEKKTKRSWHWEKNETRMKICKSCQSLALEQSYSLYF